MADDNLNISNQDTSRVAFQQPPTIGNKEAVQRGRCDSFSATTYPNGTQTRSSQVAKETFSNQEFEFPDDLLQQFDIAIEDVKNLSSKNPEEDAKAKAAVETNNTALGVLQENSTQNLQRNDAVETLSKPNPLARSQYEGLSKPNPQARSQYEGLSKPNPQARSQYEGKSIPTSNAESTATTEKAESVAKLMTEIEKKIDQKEIKSKFGKLKSSITSKLFRVAVILRISGELKVDKISKKEVEKIRNFAEAKLAKNEGQPISAQIKGKAFLISSKLSKTGETKIQLTDIESKQALGKGQFGTAWKIHKLTIKGDIIKTGAMAVKTAHLEKGKADIQNEKEMLVYLHRNGRAKGIQKLGEVYEGDLGKYDYETNTIKSKLELTSENKIDAFYQVVSGLANDENDGVLHGDIKGENILMKKEKDGTVTCDLADFGGARRTENVRNILIKSKDLKEDLHKLLGTSTKAYLPYKDREMALNFVIIKNPEGFISARQKSDAFALGKTMYEMYTGLPDLPTELAKDNFPFFTPDKDGSFTSFEMGVRDQLEKSGCPSDINKIIVSLLNPQLSQRITGNEAKQKLEQVMRNHPEYGNLAKKHNIQ